MILITGGAGFIGSALIWHLNEIGIDNIVISDHLGSGNKWRNLAKRRFSKYISKDKLLPWLNQEGLEVSFDAIIHIGACSSTTETDVDYLIENNFNFSQNLWKYCTKYRIPLIYASSAATYGDGSHGFSDDPNITPRLVAMNPYGFSKLKFDQSILSTTYRPPFWVGLRFFNVYGPNEYHKGTQSSVMYHFLPQIKDRKIIRLFKSYRNDIKDGQQKRDFIYVKDIAKVIYHFFIRRYDEQISGIYNLGTGIARTFEDAAMACLKSANISNGTIEYIPMPEALKSQYQYYTQADTQKLRTLGGYTESFFSLEEGIEDYYRQYLLTEDQYF